MQLTQKETAYLKDAESQEQLCVNLYQRYSQAAQDPQLSQILRTIASQEQQHLQSIKQMQQGQIPATQSGGGHQQASGASQSMGMQAQAGQSATMQQGTQRTPAGGQGTQQSPDQQLCEELLSIEKAVSDLYDHAVFEFTDHQARTALDHIQQEEHHHGFMLYQYMNQQGWYQAQ